MISIIVPVYNTQRYLHRCIESILKQSYKDLEIILIDDGSTDNSLSICQEYASRDKRIKVMHKDNEGQGAARNLALDICKGEYIGFVDSDDYIMPEMYQIMLESIKFHKADLAICGFSRDHNFTVRKQPTPKKYCIYDNITLIKNYINTPYITTSVCNKLYSRGLWENVRFPKIRAREDVSILYKVLGKSQCAVHIGSCQYIQFVRPGSTERTKFSEAKLSAIPASRANMEFIESNYPELIKYSFLRVTNTYVNLMQDIISSFQYFKQKSIYQKLYKEFVIELGNVFEIKEFDLEQYSRLCDIRDNQGKFFLCCHICGIKNLIVNFATRVLPKN
ncbi:glycosyltransferase family 2 protein [Clostridium magnum]|uniref:Putative glycosyltransferase EpsJ n=1 Tax=Clostridium magnum DSM 2767 TaxID=1121326 RepID=A0A161X6I4_9CLOT|nr:glycosyltransferase family 2 protein [Clostridium magnum]KZL89726.1 putative glycosyltransferase EpsJ [Clostridium magnum DSM 2767]SHH65018.1 Glycosyl transferase family 2 [Clostridium magnum DSM 2767]